MNKLILSTVGTSIITNWFREKKKEFNSTYSRYANLKEKDIDIKIRPSLAAIFIEIKADFLSLNLESASLFSAEINSISHLYDGILTPKGDVHFLLCSDTWFGEVTTNILQDWLESKGFQVQIHKQQDLQTNISTDLQLALSDLVRWVQESIVPYKDNHFKITFNLTGGFKGVQGFLQSVGMFYADETTYKFEGASEMMRIPRLPIILDTQSLINNHLADLRKISLNIRPENIDSIAETLIMKIDNEIALSPWGEIIWDDIKQKTYSTKLLPSPLDSIVYSDRFLPSMQNLECDRIKQINQKLDVLAKYFLSNKTINPKSLDFKVLSGNPCPPSSHEIDAWSDQDAKRIFGHYEKDKFVIDCLHKALH